MKSKFLVPLFVLAAVVVVGYVLMPADTEDHPPPLVSIHDQSLINDKTSTEVTSVVASESITTTSPEADSEFEIVHGIQVRKDRNCTLERRYIDVGDGTVIEGFSCTPNQPAEPGAYEEYDNATLAGMSYSDSLAAEILGKRLADIDPGRARMLLMRSVALRPQITNPILWLASVNYSLVATNGEPAIHEMSQNYLLARVAEELGTIGAAASIRSHLSGAGLEDEDFLKLEKEVIIDLIQIRDIQLEVRGHSELTELSL